MTEIDCYGMGWLRDYPDIRDYHSEHSSIKPMLKKIGIVKSAKTLPSSMDLRKWCSPIEDQESLGSCTAHAGVGMIEYYERRAFGKHIDASRLFLYKVTRNLMKTTGDTGASLRATMSALVLFGAPPEEFYPYVINCFDKEPTAFCYAFAQNYQSLQYMRLDPPGTSTADLLQRIKTNLVAGIPAIFGFTVYSSISNAGDGLIPYPGQGEKVVGGHAIMTVGFDDNLKIKNPGTGLTTTGALLIRNSWGTSWGDGGYGWLPYDYVLKGLAVDWWTLLKNEWIDTGEFKI